MLNKSLSRLTQAGEQGSMCPGMPNRITHQIVSRPLLVLVDKFKHRLAHLVYDFLVIPNLVTDDLQVLVEFGHVGFYLLLMVAEHLQTFGQGFVTLSLEFGVGLHLLDRHAGSPEFGQKINPADVVVGVAAMGVIGPANRVDEAHLFVITERMNRQPGGRGYFLNGKFVGLCVHDGKSII